MKIINNATIFSAELPNAELLRHHISELPFKPVGEAFISSAGFVENKATGELLTEIEGGYSISVRFDEKVLPASSVNSTVADAVEIQEKGLGRKLEKDERGYIKERVMADLIAKALIKTTIINAFYSPSHNYLIVPVTNRSLAQIVIGLLIKAVGSVKTSTIHVDDVKGGLTTRLGNHIDGDSEAFDGFKMGESCLLKDGSNKASFDLDNLDRAREGLIEALHANMMVERMELVHGEMSFKITKEFQLRGIDYFGDLTEDESLAREEADAAQLWRLEAAVQLLQLTRAIDDLCALFGYKAPVLEAITKIESDAVSQGDDPLLEAAKALVCTSGNATITNLQRKLKIGYNRAARLMTDLQLLDVVSAPDENGKREVIG